jgi:hypothetical protein
MRVALRIIGNRDKEGTQATLSAAPSVKLYQTTLPRIENDIFRRSGFA